MVLEETYLGNPLQNTLLKIHNKEMKYDVGHKERLPDSKLYAICS